MVLKWLAQKIEKTDHMIRQTGAKILTLKDGVFMIRAKMLLTSVRSRMRKFVRGLQF